MASKRKRAAHSRKMSDMDRLRTALCLLTDALCIPAVAHGREEITVRLSMEAGFRFEIWARQNLPAGFNCWTRGGIDPRRGIVIHGVTFTWPVQMVCFPATTGESNAQPRPIATFTRDIPGRTDTTAR